MRDGVCLHDCKYGMSRFLVLKYHVRVAGCREVQILVFTCKNSNYKPWIFDAIDKSLKAFSRESCFTSN